MAAVLGSDKFTQLSVILGLSESMYGLYGHKSVWFIDYRRDMGYVDKIPAYQLGKWKIIWIIKEYGLYGVWVRGESTV